MSEQADGNGLDGYVTSFTASSEPLSSHDGLVIVGKGTRLTGTIQSCQLLDVHGVLEADVVTDRLIVRDGGGIKGVIRTDNAEIQGVVEGQLTVHQHVNIQSTAQIAADIMYKTMELSIGGQLSGKVKVHPASQTHRVEAAAGAEVIPMNGDEHTSALNRRERQPCVAEVVMDNPVVTQH